MLLRKSTQFDNKDSGPKAQATGYLSSQKYIKFFQKQILSKEFCHFPNVRMRKEASRKEAIARPQSGRKQK